MGKITVAVLVGALVGLGAYTFQYAEGTSYFSSDPNACANCHIMKPQLDSWQKGSHHAVATCVDCHLPHHMPEKLIAKAANGWAHSKAFTLGGFDEPIRIKPQNLAILQANCLGCHTEMIDNLVHGATTDDDAVRCVQCHRSVGHGPTHGLGGPDRGEKLERGTP